jgi:hypothetical protein
VAGVDRDAVDPLSVAEGAPSEQELFKVERNGGILVLKLNIALKGVDGLIFLVTLDGGWSKVCDN